MVNGRKIQQTISPNLKDNFGMRKLQQNNCRSWSQLATIFDSCIYAPIDYYFNIGSKGQASGALNKQFG